MQFDHAVAEVFRKQIDAIGRPVLGSVVRPPAKIVPDHVAALRQQGPGQDGLREGVRPPLAGIEIDDIKPLLLTAEGRQNRKGLPFDLMATVSIAADIVIETFLDLLDRKKIDRRHMAAGNSSRKVTSERPS